MGITQQLGASSLIRPGVIDNTAARPASPYEGQVIFQKDTDQLLVWNGTAWVIPNSPAQNPQGLEFITSSTFSATALDGIFTSDYDNYRIVVSNVTTTGSNALIQFKYRNTSNATDSTAQYYSVALRYDGGTTYNYNINASPQAETAVNCIPGSNWSGFVMDVHAPRLAKNTMTNTQGIGAITYITNVQSSTVMLTTTAYAGIIFNLTAGTITGGQIAVYGYRKA
jgi:hypothetical protein